jgi:hypothetical protein
MTKGYAVPNLLFQIFSGQERTLTCERRGKRKAATALANKNARTIWAMLAYGTEFNLSPLCSGGFIFAESY